MDKAPLCLGCSTVVAQTAIYCRQCYLAIKQHRNPEPMPDTSGWTAHDRGDLPGQWDEACANSEDMSQLDELDCFKRWRAGLKHPAWYSPPKIPKGKGRRG